MHGVAFDRLSRTLGMAGSRRAALATLLASAAGVRGLGAPSSTGAQGCQDNGTRCDDGSECCSGRCKQRHRDKHGTCRQAKHQGECTVGENSCGGSSIVCGNDGGGGLCLCFVTTTGRSFCGAFSTIQPGDCGCASNTECEQRVGKGARCVETTSTSGSGSTCGCPIGTTTGCMAPCQNLDPVP